MKLLYRPDLIRLENRLPNSRTKILGFLKFGPARGYEIANSISNLVHSTNGVLRRLLREGLVQKDMKTLEYSLVVKKVEVATSN